MIFFNTWAFALAALAPVIVLLYLLKLKRRAAPVSTLMFWQRALREQPRRAFFQQLRQWLSLLLHLLIFALILLALARPALNGKIRDDVSTVLIIDDRGRMQSIGADGTTAFSRAITGARRLAAGAGPLRQIALLTLAGGPGVQTPFTGDEEALGARLRTLQCTDAGGGLPDVIRFASELLASRVGEKRIVVFTDLPPAELPSTPKDVILDFVSEGNGGANIALTAFAAKPLPASPDTFEFFLETSNFQEVAAETTVEISRDGELIDVRPLHLQPGEIKRELFTYTPPVSTTPARNWLTARLTGKDALAVDDVAYATLPVSRPLSVLLVSKGNWFLEKFLGTVSRLRFEMLEPEAFHLDATSQFDAVILDEVIPPGYDLASTPGNFLFLHQTPFNTGGGVVDHPIFEEEDRTHPIARLADLERVTFAQASAMVLPEKGSDGWNFSAPLRAVEHPLIIAGERHLTNGGDQRLAAYAFDIGSSDLPLRPAFPLLLADTLHWLSGASHTEALAVRAGERIALPGAAHVDGVPTQPTGNAQGSTAGPRRFDTPFQPLKNGFYRVTSGTEESWLAVNTFDSKESALRKGETKPSPIVNPVIDWLVGHNTGYRLPLWYYLAGAALLLLIAEWRLFHRRTTE